MRAFILGVLCLTAVSAMYDDSDDVFEITAENFESDVLGSDGVWLVEFYAPWCGHCKTLAPDWKKLATALKGVVNVGAVDMTEHASVGEPYGVTGFPTIKAFGLNKEEPVAYDGARSAKALASFAVKQVKQVIRSRLGLGAKPKADPAAADAPKPKKEKKKSPVIKLTAKNFQESVMESEDLWLVEFFAPWCGHCKNLAPHWKKAAKQLEGKVKVATVDATVEGDLAKDYGVSGYPTIKVFPAGEKGDAEEWRGGRDTNSIVKEALRLLEGETETETEEEESGDSAVVKLTDANFQELVLDSQDTWLVEFYAPWCGHCKNLAPHWEKAAVELEGKVQLGAVDCTVENGLKDKYDIGGFPTIKVFPAGPKVGEPEAYEGGRTTESIVEEALELVGQGLPAPEVVELTSSEVYDENCAGRQLCLLAFIPHILDSGVDGRENYLSALRTAANSFKKQSFGYLWSEAAKQMNIEQSLDVGGSGYPALIVMSHKKKRFVPFRSGFSEESLVEFIGRVLRGAEKTIPMQALPKAETTEPWDGKEGQLPVDDYDAKEEL